MKPLKVWGYVRFNGWRLSVNGYGLRFIIISIGFGLNGLELKFKVEKFSVMFFVIKNGYYGIRIRDKHLKFIIKVLG